MIKTATIPAMRLVDETSKGLTELLIEQGFIADKRSLSGLAGIKTVTYNTHNDTYTYTQEIEDED